MGWTELNREVERNRQLAEGILAMLISFAAMAARLPGLPAPVRHELLGVLCQAEASIRLFIFTKLQDFAPPLPREAWLALSVSLAEQPGDEGERLASSFRALAMILSAILAQARKFGRLGRRDPRNIQPFAPCGSLHPAQRTPLACLRELAQWQAPHQAFDTS